MTGTSFCPRAAISALAGAVVLVCGSAAQAAACTTEEEALDQYTSLVQSAVQRISSESAPDTLRKDKIGLVLVARAAASRETDQNGLRRDLNALSQQLTRQPGDICRAVERIRQTHGL